jgi:hypothetical protein
MILTHLGRKDAPLQQGASAAHPCPQGVQDFAVIAYYYIKFAPKYYH